MEDEIQTIIASMVYVISTKLEQDHAITIDEEGREALYQHTDDWINRVIDAAIRALAFGEVPQE